MKKLIYALMPLALLWTASCSKNETKTFDDKPSLWLSGDTALRPTADSMIFSFSNVRPDEMTHDVKLGVNVTGYASNEDRTFNLEVVADKTNVTAADYSIGELVVPAGSTKAYIPVTVHRKMSNPEWDLSDVEQVAARLTVRLLPSDDFQVGASERKEYAIWWHDRLTRPSKWGVVESYLGLWTVYRHTFLIEVVGIGDDFNAFIADYEGKPSRLYGLQTWCTRLLNEYNATHPQPYPNPTPNYLDDEDLLIFGNKQP